MTGCALDATDTRLARHDIAAYLDHNGFAQLVPVAVLLVSELVTNAVVHANGAIGPRAHAAGGSTVRDMAEVFSQRDLAGSRFHHVNLASASFDHVSLRGATFFEVDLSGVKMRGANLRDVDISGDLNGVFVNSIEIGPLIEAELDRRHPERAKLRPTDADGYREAWAVIEQLWAETVARAEQLDPTLLHERVNGEWSFIETLRHLVFATDAWVCRVILGDPSPWDRLDLPWDEMPDVEGIPRDRDARPALDDVLALRADRMARVRRLVADLTDDQLAGTTAPVRAPGWPPPIAFPARDVLGIVLNEEWWHRQFAERDLDAVVTRT